MKKIFFATLLSLACGMSQSLIAQTSATQAIQASLSGGVWRVTNGSSMMYNRAQIPSTLRQTSTGDVRVTTIDMTVTDRSLLALHQYSVRISVVQLLDYMELIL